MEYFLNQERINKIDQRAACILQSCDIAIVNVVLVVVKKIGKEGFGLDAGVTDYKVIVFIRNFIIYYFLLSFLLYHYPLPVWNFNCESYLLHFQGIRAFQ